MSKHTLEEIMKNQPLQESEGPSLQLMENVREAIIKEKKKEQIYYKTIIILMLGVSLVMAYRMYQLIGYMELLKIQQIFGISVSVSLGILLLNLPKWMSFSGFREGKI